MAKKQKEPGETVETGMEVEATKGDFGAIAVMATEREVADSVGAATTPGHNVIDLKGGLTAPTVHAAPSEFLQQVAADFPATQYC